MNIDELLDRYFEGETSAEEEGQLRTFFASGKVPERLTVYIPLFAYFDEEIAKEQQAKPVAVLRSQRGGRIPFNRRTVLWLASGVAACMLLVLGVGRQLNPMGTFFCSDNYVVINGRCYTDIHKVRSMAFEALQEVATPTSEYFPQEDGDAATREIIDNQLKELGSLFSDDE